MANIKIDTQCLLKRDIFTFIAISLFYLFETAQMAYYNVLAPSYLQHDVYSEASVAAISAAYYYGDMFGLFPIGYALDRFPLRSSLIFALIGTTIGSFLLYVSDSFTMQWISRFICGFFGGTFSFIGGIRVIATITQKRFTYFMSVFLTAGMLGAMLCQYPLLLAVNHFGPRSAMFIMFSIGGLIAIFNWFFLHPPIKALDGHENKKYTGTVWQMCKEIGFNLRNWGDVLMVVLLETPATIIGTLWGVILVMDYFHFSSGVSSGIVTAMLGGTVVGLPLLGYLADERGNPAWMITFGALVCFLLTLILFFLSASPNPWLIASLFFALGFFSSSQTIGFNWVTRNMKPELIGRNSAFNSVIFMATNGGFKQVGACLLGIPAIFMAQNGVSGNLLIFILVSMLVVVFYTVVLRRFFVKIIA
jgi:MFS family permease